MTVTTLTSREFNQDTSGAKKAASQGPVFITDRGRPAHVLLTIEDYLRLTGGHMSLAEALAQTGTDFDFNPPRVGSGIFADQLSGIYAALAIVAALQHRQQTGEGRVIDLAMAETVTQLIGPFVLDAARSGRLPTRTGNRDN